MHSSANVDTSKSSSREYGNTSIDANYIARTDSNGPTSWSHHNGGTNVSSSHLASKSGGHGPVWSCKHSIGKTVDNWPTSSKVGHVSGDRKSPTAPTVIHLRKATLAWTEEETTNSRSSSSERGRSVGM